MRDDGSCLAWFNESRDWFDALRDCLNRGGDLTSVADQATHDTVQALTGGQGPVWIGLHDLVVENAFEWTDGTSFSFALFSTGGSADAADCAQANGTRWADADCATTSTSGYVCTFAPLDTCGDRVQDNFESCDDGNQSSGDGCSGTCQIETGFSCAGPFCGRTPRVVTPADNLTTLLEGVSGSDVLLLEPGIYATTALISRNVIVGAPAGGVTIVNDATDSTFRVQNAARLSLWNLQVSTTADKPLLRIENSSVLEVDSCTLGPALKEGILTASSLNAVHVRRTKFVNISREAITMQGSDYVIENNVFIGVGLDGGTAIALKQTRAAAVFAHNTLVAGGAACTTCSELVKCDATSTFIESSIIFFNSGTALSSRCVAIESLVEGTVLPAAIRTRNTDPLFVDLPSGDLRLQAGSPAVDEALLSRTPRDFAGVVRAGPRDIGAFEGAAP